MSFLASIFGTILNFIYNIVNNYGFAIILFSILLKVVLLPLSIKQQKTMIKTTKLQEQMKALQFKYKNNPEKLNQETIRLYKSENMSPFSGCLSAILQLVILLAVFYMVKSPLTFVKGVSEEDINNYKNELQSANLEVNQAYPEISIIRHKGKEDEKVYLNMEFLGLDLSKVPMQNLSDPKVYIIPILYILSTFISTKLTTSMNKKDKDKKLLNDHVEEYEGESKEVKEEVQEVDMMEQTNKSMSLLMPIMSISISLVAPLGLALYWLTSNVLMILERVFMNKYFKSKEEKENVK
ncbi:MAG TPA: YidC/Oxa1 family membrane protein insertase [Clostridiaceae bacterium]|jgi:membrane protein insertase, yidC/oxa1 family|nr:YidC/Oxa1 family membrane protein insertase [Clostridium sp.]MEE0126828.1 YidC/Oxa1 family membrane protein insertase [Clostridia bacterium]HJJ11977.1 YidC/Oxa1 family membrane protein insertase [Clostridiaceae bacterium]